MYRNCVGVRTHSVLLPMTATFRSNSDGSPLIRPPPAVGLQQEYDIIVLDKETDTVVAIVEVKRSFQALVSGCNNVPLQASSVRNLCGRLLLRAWVCSFRGISFVRIVNIRREPR